MRFVMFYHSLVSDWNHGNAHFLRGVMRDLRRRGHQVVVHEPLHGWSRSQLLADHGIAPLAAFARAYPDLEGTSRAYLDVHRLDLDSVLGGADVVIVHEWSDPELVARIGAHRAQRGRYALLFHDTHHRSVTDPQALARYDLSAYDGVLAFGAHIRDLYGARGWARRAWVWHEAADTTVFRPLAAAPEGDLVWIGNWGDGERSAELREFLIEPVRALGLKARVYGVRYPPEARRALAEAGIQYGGWLPNFEVASTFARFRATVHVPRRPYAEALPGIPTIRPFEALACGIPLVSAPWRDEESLFCAGRDYLVARDGAEMTRHLAALMASSELGAQLAAHGRRTIAARHTCTHRVDELLGIVEALARPTAREARAAAQAAS
jgi:spore maturation protein CgeB